MEIIVGKYSGFCMGVRRAVDTAFAHAAEQPYLLGDIIHNRRVMDQIRAAGIRVVENLEEVPDGATLIIRSHGEPKSVYDRATEKGLKVVDATCAFVRKVQQTARKYHELGYTVVIVGEQNHPEVVGINGWCENQAIVFCDRERILDLSGHEKVCIVSQTTQNPEDFAKILENIAKDDCKIVEVFDTICYTTRERNLEAEQLAGESDAVVVIGGRNSSNTRKLYQSARRRCADVLWVEDASGISGKQLKNIKKVSIVAGASTPGELIKEVKLAMAEEIMKNDAISEETTETTETVTAAPEVAPETAPEAVAETAESEVQAAEPAAEEAPAAEPQPEEEAEPVLGDNITMEDVMKVLEKPKKAVRRGQILKTTIVTVTDEGVMLQNGAKGELLLPKAEASMEEEFDKSQFVPGDELEVMVTNTDPLQVSRKAMLLSAIEDAQVEEIRNGAEFKVKVENYNKGGLTSRLGSYSVFIPASQIRIGYVKAEDLPKYVGKELRVKALKIEKRNITASTRPILEAERAQREADRKAFLEQFFKSIEVGQVVEGKVVRFAEFGAFVNVNGFDCLAHISDLAWTNVKRADDVLKKDQTYEFVVLKVDPENQRVSIGYKQLQPKPWTLAAEKYPAGSVIKGKVVRIAGFGAFVEVEPGIDGLVHVSQISHDWIENPTSALKVGEEIEAKVLEINPDEEKMTLSIKALLPEPEVKIENPNRKSRTESFEKKFEKRERTDAPRRERKPRDEEPKEWTSDENGGASIGELLKGLNLNIDEEKSENE